MRINKLIFGVLILTACSQSVEPTESTISGEYQSQSENMILWLKQSGYEAKATLMWQGFIFEIEGTYRKSTNQLRLSGNAFGYQNLTFDLWYTNQTLSGGYNYNANGTKSLTLKWSGEL